MTIQVPFPQVETRAAAYKKGYWWRVLLVALGLYILGAIILFLTNNAILFPTVSMLGSFMFPVAYVAFFYEHRHLSRLSVGGLSLTFLYGGLMGVFAASILEPLFIQKLTFLTAFEVGVIEEFVKILGVLVISRHRGHDSQLDGMILGAAAGMSFAALESMGYAFSALIRSGGSLSTMVGLTLMRGLLSPLGHGTWTAILVGVMFRESNAGRFRINRAVLGAYVTVVVLHALWDGLPGVVGNITGSFLDVLLSQTLVGLVGIFLLWRNWRKAVWRQSAIGQLVASPPVL